jgi:hypothetical protein
MRLLFVAALCAGRLLNAALPEYLPPDTKVLVGFSLRGLIDAPLFSGLADAKTTAAGFLAGSPLAGIDPLKDIDGLIIASTGQGENAPSLLVIRGRFATKLLPPETPPYKGVPVYEDQKKANGTVALLDNNTLLAGDATLVRAAIDRRGQASQLSSALVERVQALETRYDLWGLGELPPGFAARTSPTAPAEIQAIDRFEFGASLRHGLELAGQIHVRTPEDAEKMAQSLKLLEMMLQMQQTSSSGIKFDLKSDNGTFRFSLTISEEELTKGLASQKANFGPAQKWDGAPAQPPKSVMITVSPAPGSVVKNDRGDAVTVTLPRKD